MSKYIGYYPQDFDADITSKLDPVNAPYFAYGKKDDLVVYSGKFVYEPEQEPEQPEQDPNYVTFKALVNNSSIGLINLSAYQTLEYSTDTTNWKTFNIMTNISLNNGDEVYVRGKLTRANQPRNTYYTRFKMTGKIAASGNCNAIWDYENMETPLKPYCGYNLFYNCSALVSVPKLPATTLANRCYDGMFYNCKSLTTAPELPATTLAEGCYENMFGGCTSLTTAPKLPATELADSCYSYMFYKCTSLTAAPELPATTLAEKCYTSMFSGCTSLITAPELLPATELTERCYGNMFSGCSFLTIAPELPATTLAKACYAFMFDKCKNLNYIKCLATDMTAGNCTYSWFRGVWNTGIFVKHPDATWPTGEYGIPSGWTVESAELE